MKRRQLTAEEKTVAGNLKKIFNTKKKELGLSQLTAAHVMGWKSQGAVGQYLNGEVPLNTDAKIKFSRLLEIEINDFDPAFDGIQIEGSAAVASTATTSGSGVVTKWYHKKMDELIQKTGYSPNSDDMEFIGAYFEAKAKENLINAEIYQVAIESYELSYSQWTKAKRASYTPEKRDRFIMNLYRKQMKNPPDADEMARLRQHFGMDKK